MKYSNVAIASLLIAVVVVGVFTLYAQQTAAVQMAKPDAGISGGKVLALEVKLDKPLPPDTSVMVRVRPESVSQLLVLSSVTPDDSTRTKITVKTTLPNVVVPGKWRLEDVFISLPSTNIWQPLEHNQLTFDVQGKPFPIPSKADVVVAK